VIELSDCVHTAILMSAQRCAVRCRVPDDRHAGVCDWDATRVRGGSGAPGPDGSVIYSGTYQRGITQSIFM